MLVVFICTYSYQGAAGGAVGPKPKPVPVCVWGVGHHQAPKYLERSLRALAVRSELELFQLWVVRRCMRVSCAQTQIAKILWLVMAVVVASWGF